MPSPVEVRLRALLVEYGIRIDDTGAADQLSTGHEANKDRHVLPDASVLIFA
jgi:hypothetical protein